MLFVQSDHPSSAAGPKLRPSIWGFSSPYRTAPAELTRVGKSDAPRAFGEMPEGRLLRGTRLIGNPAPGAALAPTSPRGRIGLRALFDKSDIRPLVAEGSRGPVQTAAPSRPGVRAPAMERPRGVTDDLVRRQR